MSFESGVIVIVHLVNPTEKHWGVMHALDATGVTLRGINVESFEDWIAQINREESQALGLGTMFVPLFRVERIFRDEQIGQVESYCQRFERRVGVDVDTYLTLDKSDPNEVPS